MVLTGLAGPLYKNHVYIKIIFIQNVLSFKTSRMTRQPIWKLKSRLFWYLDESDIRVLIILIPIVLGLLFKSCLYFRFILLVLIFSRIHLGRMKWNQNLFCKKDKNWRDSFCPNRCPFSPKEKLCQIYWDTCKNR